MIGGNYIIIDDNYMYKELSLLVIRMGRLKLFWYVINLLEGLW